MQSINSIKTKWCCNKEKEKKVNEKNARVKKGKQTFLLLYRCFIQSFLLLFSTFYKKWLCVNCIQIETIKSLPCFILYTILPLYLFILWKMSENWITKYKLYKYNGLISTLFKLMFKIKMIGFLNKIKRIRQIYTFIK